jgi:hypothetical protein
MFFLSTTPFWGGVYGLENWCSRLLVEIGPEGWTLTQQPPEIFPSLHLLPRSYLYHSRRGKEMRKHSTGHKEMLSGPKTERLAVAFGALFSLQCVCFITRGSLFIGGPWA